MKLKFLVTHELLAQLLHLPPTAHIENICSHAQLDGRTMFYVEDSALPTNVDYVEANPSSTQREVTWNWNVDG